MPRTDTHRHAIHVRRRRAAALVAAVLLTAGLGAFALLNSSPESPDAALPAIELAEPEAPAPDPSPDARQPTQAPVLTPPIAPESTPTTTESTPAPERDSPMLVGFMDDVSFRWHPSRARMLDRAQATGARVIRAFVQWHIAAPKRPAPGRAPFAVPRMHELDELVAGAEARQMEVLFTIWGTPSWANGGLGPNHAPTDPADLGHFAQGLAERYPSVRLYTIWNEPNTQRFLTPQFDAAGRSVSPTTYAALFRAAYDGIKDASPDALVALGGTSSHGRDAPSTTGMQDRHSPGRFAELLSEVSPDLEFDAYAHQPYPVHPSVPPEAQANWPNVQLASLTRFSDALDTWFGREDIPIWVTEFGYQTAPAEPTGVSEAVQAEYAARAIELAASVPQVDLFIWFGFADHESNLWQSGLLDATGKKRPVYESFTAAVDALG